MESCCLLRDFAYPHAVCDVLFDLFIFYDVSPDAIFCSSVIQCIWDHNALLIQTLIRMIIWRGTYTFSLLCLLSDAYRNAIFIIKVIGISGPLYCAPSQPSDFLQLLSYSDMQPPASIRLSSQVLINPLFLCTSNLQAEKQVPARGDLIYRTEREPGVLSCPFFVVLFFFYRIACRLIYAI